MLGEGWYAMPCGGSPAGPGVGPSVWLM